MTWKVYSADCRLFVRDLEPDSIDSIVCDPPYDLVGQKTSRNGSVSTGDLSSPYGRSGPSKARGFMGMSWDSTGVAFDSETWAAMFRVLKPGGHLVAFGGTRTFHRMAVAIEDAGFEIRDTLCWLYGQGFPKSRDISKDFDRMAGVERPVIGSKPGIGGENLNDIVRGSDVRTTDDPGGKGIGAYGVGAKQTAVDVAVTEPVTDLARQWHGWGTALKPAWEPIILARKPINAPNVATNVERYGTGAINILGTAVEGPKGDATYGTSNATINPDRKFNASPNGAEYRSKPIAPDNRWPPNVAMDEQAAAMLDASTGTRRSGKLRAGTVRSTTGGYNGHQPPIIDRDTIGDEGSVTRFFYCPKASKVERNTGLDGAPATVAPQEYRLRQGATSQQTPHANAPQSNPHPTVKPINLLRWLSRLVTPPGGVILDPFCGSGSGGIAAVLEGFDYIGVEADSEHGYVEIARQRIAYWAGQHRQLPLLPY